MTESEGRSLLVQAFRRQFSLLRDAWWQWRMKPGAEACGRWIRVERDLWIAALKDTNTDDELADASCCAMDGIYGFMVAHGWMEMDEGAADGPTLPLQPYPEPTS